MRRIFFSFVCLMSPFLAMGQQYTIMGSSSKGQYIVEVEGKGLAEQYDAIKKQSPAIAEDCLFSMFDEYLGLAIKDYCERILAEDAVASKLQQFRQSVAREVLNEILKYQGQGITGYHEKSSDGVKSFVKISISDKGGLSSLFVEKMQDAVDAFDDKDLQTDFVRNIFARVVGKSLSQYEHKTYSQQQR